MTDDNRDETPQGTPHGGADKAPPITSETPVIRMIEVAPGVWEPAPGQELPPGLSVGGGAAVGKFRVLIEHNTDVIPEHHKKPLDPAE